MNKTRYLLLLALFLLVVCGGYTYCKFKEKAASATEMTSDLNRYYQAIPEQASVFTDTFTYVDKDLTSKGQMIEAFTNLKIKSLMTSNSGLMLFQLEDNSFIPALKSIVYPNNIGYKKLVNEIKTIKNQTETYKIPQENKDYLYDVVNDSVNISLQQEVEIDKEVFVSFVNQGQLIWIKKNRLENLSPNYERLQKLLNENYDSENFSIYIQDLASDESASINPDQLMYSASLAKLPILYWVQKQIAEGLDSNKAYQYVNAVNEGAFSFQPAGSGFLSKTADNKEYKLSDLITYTGKRSDNVASNLLSYYLCENNKELFNESISLLAGRRWNLEDRQASSRMTGKLMVELYKLGGQSYQALKHTDFDNQRIPKYLPSNISIAHKIGEAYDFHHDVAIVEAPKAYLISVETQNDVDIDDISRLSKEVYEILVGE
ncbi:class A beta-lactamase-related serine hydrolase [Streptococcaceae bacterium ESL0729]|nr:class A beta-lactamase-related serine hydrolase [Streptococcaceae bacterium ESL0729]